MKRIEDVYVPLLRDTHGIKLLVQGLWEDEKVNAAAGQNDDHWYVKVYGGLARRPEVTEDGLLLALCHELGHHLGGYPAAYKLSAEGQSDFFSTLSCGRLLFEDELETNSRYRNIIPEFPKDLCDDSWASEEQQNLCYRLMMAGKSLAMVFAVKKDITIDFSETDLTKVSYTRSGHPNPQCRLDTFMAGALCTADFDPFIIPGKNKRHKAKQRETESAKYVCSILNEDTVGLRPRCWFKSKFE